MISTLPQTEESFRLLVENLPGVVYLRRNDVHTTMLYVTDAIESLTGYPREAFLERAITVVDLCHPDDRATYDAAIDRALAGRGAFHLVYRLRHRSGSWRWVDEHGVGVYLDGELATVEGFITDITDRRLAELRSQARRERSQATADRQLTHEATHDALTGLINRAEFERRLERAFQSARTTGAHHALCYLDLDRLKRVNDTNGHLAGDAVLRLVSQELSAAMRTRDTLARVGGDEFVLLLEHCDLAQATEVAANLLQVVRKTRFRWKERELSIGISIGVAPIAADNESPSTILDDADAACYAAKSLGGNCVQVAAANVGSRPFELGHNQVERAIPRGSRFP